MSRRLASLLALLVGVGLIAAAVVLVGVPLVQVWQRGRADQDALSQWNTGGSQAITGSVAPGHEQDSPLTCGASAAPSDAYALVTFPTLSQFGYSGVAGDGTWDLLHQRSMVHYHGTPDPGQQGNMIIAFHREPNYQHIDQLNTGDTVDVQDRSCHTWQYRVVQRWDLAPSRVTQLEPTDGHDLTLLTCTPWWQDYHRLVWRATLVGPVSTPGQSG